MDGVRGGIVVVLMAVRRGVAEAPDLLMAYAWSQDVSLRSQSSSRHLLCFFSIDHSCSDRSSSVK